MHSTAKIGLRLMQALLNVPSMEDPRLPGAVILNYEAAKLGEELNHLPDLQKTNNIIIKSIKQLKTVKTTVAQEQASLFEHQIHDDKKLKEYTSTKEKLIKKYQETQAKLILNLKGLFKNPEDPSQRRKSHTLLRDMKEEMKALGVETALQKQKGLSEHQRLKQILLQIPTTSGQQIIETPKPY